MSYNDTNGLDGSEQVGYLFKAALGFPTTNETKPFFAETKVKANNYILSTDIASDPIPSEVFSGTEIDVTTIGLTNDDFASGGKVEENSTGVIRKYTKLILDEVPTSSGQGYYKQTGDVNHLADALQFNTSGLSDGTNFYIYSLSSENTPDTEISSGSGGNYVFDVKNGVLFVPDYNSQSKFHKTNNKPVFTFYKYIGSKGVSGGGGNIPDDTFYQQQSILDDANMIVAGNMVVSDDIRVRNSIRFGHIGWARIEGDTTGMVYIPDFTTHLGSSWWVFGNDTTGTVVKWANPQNKIGLRVASGCLAQYFLGSSDRRIKTDVSNVNISSALGKVNAIESKEYHYIDPTLRQEHKTVGFIAQQVRDILPNAVKIQKEILPDELRNVDDKWVGNKIRLDDVDLSSNHTRKVKFYVSDNDGEEECKEISMDDNNECDLGKKYDKVFLYGKEVNDFHCLNKDRIFALHHSAIQELSRKYDAVVEEVNILKQENTALKQTNIEILERLGELEVILINLQNK